MQAVCTCAIAPVLVLVCDAPGSWTNAMRHRTVHKEILSAPAQLQTAGSNPQSLPQLQNLRIPARLSRHRSGEIACAVAGLTARQLAAARVLTSDRGEIAKYPLVSRHFTFQYMLRLAMSADVDRESASGSASPCTAAAAVKAPYFAGNSEQMRSDPSLYGEHVRQSYVLLRKADGRRSPTAGVLLTSLTDHMVLDPASKLAMPGAPHSTYQ
jgi:hypothetical protein